MLSNKNYLSPSQRPYYLCYLVMLIISLILLILCTPPIVFSLFIVLSYYIVDLFFLIHLGKTPIKVILGDTFLFGVWFVSLYMSSIYR